MGSPFEQVFIGLRQQIADACDEISASIEKNGFVRGKVAERATGLLELYDLGATHDDKELRAKLVSLKEKIGAIGDDRARDAAPRSIEAIALTLSDIIRLATTEAAEVADISRAAFMEV